jgi:hypothetical protein
MPPTDHSITASAWYDPSFYRHFALPVLLIGSTNLILIAFDCTPRKGFASLRRKGNYVTSIQWSPFLPLTFFAGTFRASFSKGTWIRLPILPSIPDSANPSLGSLDAPMAVIENAHTDRPKILPLELIQRDNKLGFLSFFPRPGVTLTCHIGGHCASEFHHRVTVPFLDLPDIQKWHLLTSVVLVLSLSVPKNVQIADTYLAPRSHSATFATISF